MDAAAKLPLGKQIAYAFGGLAMNLTNLVISQWVLKRYVPSGGEPLVAAGVFTAMMLAGRITDGITDPLIGYWSDNARYKRGRRIPFILWGTVPFALVFFLLWTPPFAPGHWGNAVYAFAMLQLYFIFYTIVVTPYLALLPEITHDARQRVNLTSLQAVFVTVGTILFGLMGLLIAAMGWIGTAALVAVLTVVSFLPTAFAIQETPQPAEQGARAGLVTWIVLTFRSKPFILLVASTSFYWFGLNLLIMMVPFWVQDLLGRSENDVTLVMGPFLLMNVIFFLVFNVLAKRFGKYRMFMVTCIGTGAVTPLLMFADRLPLASPLALSIAMMALVGVPVAGFLMLPFALLSDVADDDEKQTGRRREGIFFGVQAIFQKTMIGLSAVAFGWLVLGGKTVSLEGLKLIPVVAAVAFLCAAAAFFKYPLREAPENAPAAAAPDPAAAS
jgi:GPH family glycoside/pentoside/hexuronide:cation symporter